METVFVFVSRDRFPTVDDAYAFVDQAYTEDGTMVPSRFVTEIALTEYEPMCIEVVHSPRALPLPELLQRASFADQWVSQLDPTLLADTAVCVFSPNAVAHPEASSLKYVGVFSYRSNGREVPARLDPL
jgi:Immunity protein 22